MGLASTFVPFFGRPAKTPRGAAVIRLAIRGAGNLRGALRKPKGAIASVVERIEARRNGRHWIATSMRSSRIHRASGEMGSGRARRSISGSTVDGDDSRRTRRPSCGSVGITKREDDAGSQTAREVPARQSRASRNSDRLSWLLGPAALAPLIARQSPITIDLLHILNVRRAPLLGTDIQGRDIWSRLVFGARVSLTVGLISQGRSQPRRNDGPAGGILW